MSATVEAFPPVFSPLDFASRSSVRTAQPPMSLADIHASVCTAADLPLARAHTLPAQAYTSEEFFEWEVSRVLRPGWQCVAHVSQLRHAGDFLNLDLLGEPLIVVRGKDQVVRVLSRVCPHRAMDIMPVGFGYEGHQQCTVAASSRNCGHTRLFLCPYHAWTFELDGGLKACPEMHRAEAFARDDHALKSFPTAVWEGFVFVNLDGKAPPLDLGLDPASADLTNFRLAELELVIAREWDCRFNWKVLVENFMESYHHLGIHHRTLQPMMPARDTWTEEERRSYIRAHLPYRDEVAAELGRHADRGHDGNLPLLPGLDARQRAEWGLFLVHPTFLLATTPDRVIWYRLQPLGPDRLKLLTTTLVPRSVATGENFARQREQATKQLTDFHLEDMEVCTAVQRGLYASGWQAGRLSHLEMPVWLLQRFLAARIRGVWPTDDRPSAPSQRSSEAIK